MQRFVPPLLDRLIDTAPLSPAESMRQALSLEQLKNAVARDLEALLNARRGLRQGVLLAFPNARSSVAAFGLDDFVSMSMSSTVDRAAICRSIEHTITDHEPRLQKARVELQQREAAMQELRFAIHAVLIAHPLHEPVNFDAVLQTTTRSYAVQSGRGAA